MAQSLPKARQGLGESQPKGARFLAPRLNPPHAQKTLQSGLKSPDGLLDELFTSLIAKYFFHVPKQPTNFKKWWRTKKFKIFNHYIMDEMFLLRKMQIIHAIKPLPGNIQSSIHRINSVRNAFAHSFFPENRREHRKLGKVLYMGKDIRTPEGLDAFITDAHDTYNFIAKRVYPGWAN